MAVLTDVTQVSKPVNVAPRVATIPASTRMAAIEADSRWTNARTPTSHASSHAPGGGDAMAVDAAAGTGSLRTLGTGATQACAGTDARLSDARTPVSHSHAQSDVTNLTTALAAKEATANKGVANGYASLNADAKITGSQMALTSPNGHVWSLTISDAGVISTVDLGPGSS